jgi:hypothetical protein
MPPRWRPTPSSATRGRSLLLDVCRDSSLKLYPIENATAQKSLDDLLLASNGLLEPQGEIEVRLSGDFIFINGTRLRLELDNYASFSHLLAIFRAVDLGALKVKHGTDRRVGRSSSACCSRSFPRRDPREDLRAAREARSRASPDRRRTDPRDRGVARGRGEGQGGREAHLFLGVAVTKDLINSVRMGRTTSVARVKRAVQSIVDQVLNNEASLIGLTTLLGLRRVHLHPLGQRLHPCRRDRQEARLQRLQLYDLGMGALLHDVGKARIPVDVLNKTSGLNDDEWRLMQTHPWLGC